MSFFWAFVREHIGPIIGTLSFCLTTALIVALNLMGRPDLAFFIGSVAPIGLLSILCLVGLVASYREQRALTVKQVTERLRV